MVLCRFVDRMTVRRLQSHLRVFGSHHNGRWPGTRPEHSASMGAGCCLRRDERLRGRGREQGAARSTSLLSCGACRWWRFEVMITKMRARSYGTCVSCNDTKIMTRAPWWYSVVLVVPREAGRQKGTKKRVTKVIEVINSNRP